MQTDIDLTDLLNQEGFQANVEPPPPASITPPEFEDERSGIILGLITDELDCAKRILHGKSKAWILCAIISLLLYIIGLLHCVHPLWQYAFGTKAKCKEAQAHVVLLKFEGELKKQIAVALLAEGSTWVNEDIRATRDDKKKEIVLRELYQFKDETYYKKLLSIINAYATQLKNRWKKLCQGTRMSGGKSYTPYFLESGEKILMEAELQVRASRFVADETKNAIVERCLSKVVEIFIWESIPALKGLGKDKDKTVCRLCNIWKQFIVNKFQNKIPGSLKTIGSQNNAGKKRRRTKSVSDDERDERYGIHYDNDRFYAYESDSGNNGEQIVKEKLKAIPQSEDLDDMESMEEMEQME